MHTNKKLAISLGVLLVLILATWQMSKPTGNSLVGLDLLNIADTSQIVRVEVLPNEASQGQPVALERSGKDWQVNGKYKADPSIVRALMGRLQLSRVKRKVGPSGRQEVSEWLRKGKKIKVGFENGEEVVFVSGGNPANTASFFQMEGSEDVYQVEVPGYSLYISGIFELTENQWRHRLLFSSDWRSIQALTVDYTSPGRDDVEIYFDKTTLKVRGPEPTDTTALENYIVNFESFYTNEFIGEGQIPLYDSLMQTEPIATIRLRDIDSSKNTNLSIFPRPGASPYTLLADEKGNYSVVDAPRIEKLLVRRQDLVVK